MNTLIKRFILFLLVICPVAFVIKQKSSKNIDEPKGKVIVIGSKNFTESIVLAHMMADIIEDQTDLKVLRKVNLGGSSLAWAALRAGNIHMYPEYVSTIVLNFYDKKPKGYDESLEQARDLLSQDGINFTTKFGVNNGYSLGVSQATADKYSIRSISDLIGHAPHLTCGSDFEFIDRPDGYKALMEAYNLKFNRVKTMDRGIAYRSILGNKLDVVVGYTTDSQFFINKLVMLEDDHQFSGCYDAGILVRKDILQEYPELQAALDKLENLLTDEEMRQINMKIDYEGMKAKTIARNILIEKGLIKENDHG